MFRDYCGATGQPALPTTVAAVAGFMRDVSGQPATQRSRLRAIAAAHRRAGLSTSTEELRPVLHPTRQQRIRSEATILIAACLTHGWPTGFTGRRDAFLIVVVDMLGLSHDRARQLTPDHLTVTPERLIINDVPVAASDDVRGCPRCAVVRWLGGLRPRRRARTRHRR